MDNKLTSRKFILTIGAIATAIAGVDLSQNQLIALVALSAIYLFAQAHVDHGAATAASSVDDVVKRVLEKLDEEKS